MSAMLRRSGNYLRCAADAAPAMAAFFALALTGTAGCAGSAVQPGDAGPDNGIDATDSADSGDATDGADPADLTDPGEGDTGGDPADGDATEGPDPDPDGEADADCVPAPAGEICNGADDDCDGSADETFACRMGEVVACETACDTAGTGICGLGCSIPGPPACTPPPESCNGSDDDCDGGCDETFDCCAGTSGSCTTSCGTAGSSECEPGCSWGACVPILAEVCDGQDQDCDGECDEGFDCCLGVPEACTTSCATPGLRQCGPGCHFGSCVSTLSETCNGSDDDCNGSPDDGAGCRIPVYRFVCGTDHFYYNGPGVPPGCAADAGGAPVFYTYTSAVAGGSLSTVELFRLYSSTVNDHFYCSTTGERDYAVSIGFVLEGNIGYCSPAAVPGMTEPLYRLYSGAMSDHFYTASDSERDSAIAGGYYLEGTECHVWLGP